MGPPSQVVAKSSTRPSVGSAAGAAGRRSGLHEWIRRSNSILAVGSTASTEGAGKEALKPGSRGGRRSAGHGTPERDFARSLGVTLATLYRWVPAEPADGNASPTPI